jgi:hypothetical protein
VLQVRQAALEKWARTYRAAIAAHPNIVPALATGLGRRPIGLRIANAVFGGLVSAGWPRREAINVGAVMRYFVLGSTLGSFASASSRPRRSRSACCGASPWSPVTLHRLRPSGA